jgi:NADP-dependent 3-hydroxy acid dehydrogenase YdfG
MPFPYKSVLVVGATSGIGLALAERMIQNGAKIIAVGRRQENLDEFVQKHGKDKAASFQFDITNLAGIPEFAKK